MRTLRVKIIKRINHIHAARFCTQLTHKQNNPQHLRNFALNYLWFDTIFVTQKPLTTGGAYKENKNNTNKNRTKTN